MYSYMVRNLRPIQFIITVLLFLVVSSEKQLPS
jgi:hypothetical protein